MDQELNPQTAPQEATKDVKVKVKVENPQQLLKDSSNALAKFGAFKMIEACIKGAQNLNPEKKAARDIFLKDISRKGERETLKATLNIWLELLGENQTVSEIVDKSQQKAESAARNLTANVKNALEATKELESAYRSVNLFYKNTEQDKLMNITIMNADLEQLKDLDNPVFINQVNEEFKANFDRMDLRGTYSLLVIPGYLGSNAVVEKWAKIAAECKVMLVTDFMDLETPDDVVANFDAANLSGGDKYRANVMMACNWLVGRGKDTEVGEESDIHVPPSSALAGKVYSTLMSQVTAGKKFGSMNEVNGVSFQLKRTEFSNLEKMGLIPMVNEYDKVLAMSAKTLFNGDNLGLQTYSVVRVFDWVMKSLMDFLNRRAFENLNVNSKNEIRGQIERFLDKHTGPGQLIEKFTIQKFEQDPVQKDRVYLDIHITPFFAAKQFVIGLDGQKGTDADSAKWNTEMKQV